MAADTTNPQQRIQTVCLLILTAVAIGAALYMLRPVLIPFVLAVFLVYCLTPVIVNLLEHVIPGFIVLVGQVQ